MFKGSQNHYYKDIGIVQNYNQELLFLKYFGVYPEIGKRYYSLFRSDNTPGCRFEWHSGVLFFVDNAGHNGNVYFDIIGAICNIYRVTIPKAINMIETENIPEYKKDTVQKKRKIIPQIKFTYIKWPDNNYFQIDPEDLYKENVFLVSNYWINEDGMWKQNHIHNPKEILTIAYYFPDTNKVKLYWPNQTFKWYSNCTNEIFGESKLDYYLEKNDNLIIITKSQKDRLILDYHHDIAAIAPQTEHSIISDRIINYCRKFKNQLILYDNDISGQNQAALLSERTGFRWILLEIGKDCYDNIGNTYLKHKLSYI